MPLSRQGKGEGAGCISAFRPSFLLTPFYGREAVGAVGDALVPGATTGSPGAGVAVAGVSRAWACFVSFPKASSMASDVILPMSVLV